MVFAFILLLYFAYRFYYWRDSLAKDYPQVILNAVLVAVMVYGLYLAMGPLSRRFQRRRIWFFVIWFLMAVAASATMSVVHYAVHMMTGGMTERFRQTFMLFSFQIFDAYVAIFVGLGISTAFRWYHEWSLTSLRLGDMEKEKAITELAYLKSQINPHFVFNTLNSIYFLIKAENEPAREALHTFSEMLRYQLYDSGNQQVPIEQEIKYLKNYIHLQRLRLDDDYVIDIQFADNLSGFFIPPLILVIPVENAFKHLSHHHDGTQNRVEIEALRTNDHFIFRCRNTISDREKPVEVGGIGLTNLKRRLELLYEERAKLTLQKNEAQYEFELILPL
ncbi:MAG: sensor histidine kinase [Bacteroidota bacterium]|nr:sensor histidine kinase [Bacteroidota bacterium]MDX5430241.1 sensor histidine kinase [Bacteroidota bacterium]MDX5469002.1 sensor histidine kinase [Bacteroidota bacterium]